MATTETVDSSDDLWFVDGEGILVSYLELDGLGDVVNPVTHPRYLTIPALNIRKLLDPQPGLTTTYYRLLLSAEELQPVPRVGSVVFSITDEQGITPISLWSGIIRRRNLYS